MGYFFPEAGVFVTAMAKTGCSTVLNLMVAVEERLVRGETSEEALAVPEDWWTIHGKRKEVYLKHWAAPRPDGTVSVVVLRNPVDRLYSAWSDKFLLSRDPAIYRLYRDQPWFPHHVNTIAGIHHALENFVSALEASDELLNADSHWKPQAVQIEGHPPYSVVLTTRNLGDLLSLIADAQPNLNWIRATSVPRLHSSDVGAHGVMTADIAARIELLYGADVELLERWGVSYPSETAADTVTPDAESVRAAADHWTATWTQREQAAAAAETQG